MGKRRMSFKVQRELSELSLQDNVAADHWCPQGKMRLAGKTPYRLGFLGLALRGRTGPVHPTCAGEAAVGEAASAGRGAASPLARVPRLKLHRSS